MRTILNSGEGWDMNGSAVDYRTQQMYSFGEAAKLAGVSSATVRNWLVGYVKREQIGTPEGRRDRSRKVEPLFSTMPAEGARVSFLQLIEIVVAAAFRKSEHVKFPVVRQAYENAQQDFKLVYPFAHKQLTVIGGHIVEVIRGDSYRSIDAPEQWTLPDLVRDLAVQFDYEEELASCWHPRGKENPIVVDPRVSAGRPTFRGRGVTIDALRWRWKIQGQTIEFIAKDFELPPNEVELALQYSEGIAA